MAYLATQELQFKLDDGSYCVVPAGRALPPKFPAMVQTLAALQRAKLVSIIPDDAVEPFELVLVPARAKAPKSVSVVEMEDGERIAAEIEAAQAESAKRVARRNARLAATEPKPTQRKGRRARK
jgi:hypothetical protein